MQNTCKLADGGGICMLEPNLRFASASSWLCRRCMLDFDSDWQFGDDQGFQDCAKMLKIT